MLISYIPSNRSSQIGLRRKSHAISLPSLQTGVFHCCERLWYSIVSKLWIDCMYSLTLLDVLKNHGNSMISGNVKNDSIVQNQDYGSQRVDYFFDHDEALKGIMSKEFKCPISLKNTCELDIELSQELDDTLPWEFQCKFIENLKIRLQDDDRACKFMQCEDLFESIIRLLKVARDKNDVKAQRIGCLLLSVLATKCRSIKTLSRDAYRLISELLESEVTEEALAIMEGLSSHENHRSKIASSGAVAHISNILDNNQTPQFQTPALKILNNLTSNRNFRSLRSSELIPKLVALSENDSLSNYCIAILKNLCGDQDNKSIIAETNGCLAFVANVLESESCEDQEQALEILVSLCSQSIDYCRLVMDEGVIPDIVRISIDGNDKAKAKAHEMLRLLRDTGSEENVVEESSAPVYDVAVNDSNIIQVENTAPSRTSRFFSKFSKTPKRKV